MVVVVVCLVSAHGVLRLISSTIEGRVKMTQLTRTVLSRHILFSLHCHNKLLWTVPKGLKCCISQLLMGLYKCWDRHSKEKLTVVMFQMLVR